MRFGAEAEINDARCDGERSMEWNRSNERDQNDNDTNTYTCKKIDMGNIIGSDCSRAGVDEETALVCLQRRRTGGATAVRRLDDDGWGG